VRVVWVVAAVGLGCGRWRFDPVRGGDAPGGDASGEGDTSGPALRCGTIEILADDFQSTTKAPAWNTYAYNGTSLAQGGGELVATMVPTGGAGAYAGYSSYHTMDLRDARFYVHVTQVLSTATRGVTRFQATPDINNNITILEAAGVLYALTNTAGTVVNVGSTPYDATADAWWQLREAQGTVYFETSPDGQTFTAFANTPTPAFAASARIDLSAGTDRPETNPGASHFASLNGGTPAGQWCPASMLADNFNSGVFAPEWGNSYSPNGSTYTESSGSVTFGLPGSAVVETALASAMAYDLSESAIITQIQTVPAVNTCNAFLRASTTSNDFIMFTANLTSLTCLHGAGGSQQQVCQVPFDPVAHKLWRLRGTGGTVYWETSPDGTTWTTQYSEPAAIALDALGIGVGARENAVVGSAQVAVFDTFNQLPP
jgi:hypothetical protein